MITCCSIFTLNTLFQKTNITPTYISHSPHLYLTLTTFITYTFTAIVPLSPFTSISLFTLPTFTLLLRLPPNIMTPIVLHSPFTHISFFTHPTISLLVPLTPYTQTPIIPLSPFSPRSAHFLPTLISITDYSRTSLPLQSYLFHNILSLILYSLIYRNHFQANLFISLIYQSIIAYSHHHHHHYYSILFSIWRHRLHFPHDSFIFICVKFMDLAAFICY